MNDDPLFDKGINFVCDTIIGACYLGLWALIYVETKEWSIKLAVRSPMLLDYFEQMHKEKHDSRPPAQIKTLDGVLKTDKKNIDTSECAVVC